MLAHLLTLAVAVLVLVPLAEAGRPLFLLVAPLVAVYGWAVRRLGPDGADPWSATAWRSLLGLGLTLVVGAVQELSLAAQAIVAGGLLLGLASTRHWPLVQLALLLGLPPALGFAGGVVEPVAWWCASLPGLLLIWERRLLPAVLPAGLLGLGLGVRTVMLGGGTDAASLLGVLRPGGGLIALGQGLIVACGVLPLLSGADPRWRRVALPGLAGATLPPVVSVWSGPWPDGPPGWLSFLSQIGMVAAAIGLFGMLCTVRRPERLAEAVLRVLVLGMAASTALVAVVPTGTTTVPAALAPLAWAFGQSLVLGAAALVARRGVGMTEDLAPVRRSPSDLMRRALTGFGRGWGDDAARWLHLQGLVPAAILLSVLPCLVQLSPGWRWAPLLVLAGIPAPGLLRLGLVPWMAVQAGLALALGLFLGLPPSGLLVLVALVLAVCGPLAAWPGLGPGWALPILLVLLAVVLPLLQQELSVPRPELVLLVGIAVLLANVLLPGRARVPVLLALLVVLLAVLLDWIPSCDPYATVQLAEMGGGAELLPLLMRLPFIALPLLALWVVRDRVERGLHQPRWRIGLRLLLPGGAALPLWIAVPELVVPMSSWVAWLLLVQALPVVVGELRDSLRSSVARLFNDGLAISLALLLLILTKALAVVAKHGDGALPAGVLGELLVPAVRDLVALTVTVAVLLTGRGLLHYRVAVAAAMVQTALYARNRGTGLLARLRRLAPPTTPSSEKATAAPRRKGFRGRRKSLPAG